MIATKRILLKSMTTLLSVEILNFNLTMSKKIVYSQTGKKMNKRTVKITLLVSPKEKKIFMEFAYRLGMDLSSLMRYLVIKEITAHKSLNFNFRKMPNLPNQN